jgi:crossover junction endodeoxyribonuclease RuvC
MTIILGIDPGSRITGYGVISFQSGKAEYIDSGCIRVEKADLPTKLKTIHQGITDIINTYQPTESGIEQVFFHENPNTAIKLGQARGAAIAAMALKDLIVAEYSARQVKKAVVGYGAATKEQIQHMIKTLLKLSIEPQADAADALAVALCHAYTRQGLRVMKGVAEKMRYGRLR